MSTLHMLYKAMCISSQMMTEMFELLPIDDDCIGKTSSAGAAGFMTITERRKSTAVKCEHNANFWLQGIEFVNKNIFDIYLTKHTFREQDE